MFMRGRDRTWRRALILAAGALLLVLVTAPAWADRPSLGQIGMSNADPEPGDQVVFSVAVTDGTPDGGILTVRWHYDGVFTHEEVFTIDSAAPGHTSSWGTDVTEGQHTVRVVAICDSTGLTAERERTFTVSSLTPTEEPSPTEEPEPTEEPSITLHPSTTGGGGGGGGGGCNALTPSGFAFFALAALGALGAGRRRK
jgi:uncharacterized protein (TIGR03382 family)